MQTQTPQTIPWMGMNLIHCTFMITRYLVRTIPYLNTTCHVATHLIVIMWHWTILLLTTSWTNRKSNNWTNSHQAHITAQTPDHLMSIVWTKTGIVFWTKPTKFLLPIWSTVITQNCWCMWTTIAVYLQCRMQTHVAKHHSVNNLQSLHLDTILRLPIMLGMIHPKVMHIQHLMQQTAVRSMLCRLLTQCFKKTAHIHLAVLIVWTVWHLLTRITVHCLLVCHPPLVIRWAGHTHMIWCHLPCRL